MSLKSVVFVALAACLVMGTVMASKSERKVKLEGCSSRTLGNLASQVQLCARNVPVEQFNDPRWRCAQEVRRGVSGSCDLDQAPELLQYCLEDNYISDSYISPAVECLRNAISYGMCC